MYGLYFKKLVTNTIKLQFKQRISLFGCNVGYIPKFLRELTPNNQEEPFKWHLSIQDMLTKMGHSDSTIIIDIKPRNKAERYVTLCELLDVWGYSVSGWTPILMGLKGLLIDANPDQYDKSNLTLDIQRDYETIYSLLYLAGSVSKGQLIGRWTSPNPSSTNSLLLWPDTLRYFMDCIKQSNPEIFQ